MKLAWGENRCPVLRQVLDDLEIAGVHVESRFSPHAGHLITMARRGHSGGCIIPDGMSPEFMVMRFRELYRQLMMREADEAFVYKGKRWPDPAA